MAPRRRSSPGGDKGGGVAVSDIFLAAEKNLLNRNRAGMQVRFGRAMRGA